MQLNPRLNQARAETFRADKNIVEKVVANEQGISDTAYNKYLH